MQFLIDKLKQIFWITFLVIFFTINQSKAQNTATSNNLLSLSISCPNNPQCIFLGQDVFPVTTEIMNNSDQDIGIPLEAIKYFLTTSYLKNQSGKIVGDFIPPGIFMPELLKKLTYLPAHGRVSLTGNYTKKYLRNIFKKEKNNKIIFYKSIIVYIHLQGSKEPIGFYKDGKFEPKPFVLEAEKVITKK